MPAQDCVRLDEHRRISPVSSRFGKKDPEQAIAPVKVRAGDGASQSVELLPEREILEDQFAMAMAGQGHRPDQQQDRL
jgi:hypothetical protein